MKCLVHQKGLKQTKLSLTNLTLKTQNDIHSISKQVVEANETNLLSDQRHKVKILLVVDQCIVKKASFWLGADLARDDLAGDDLVRG